LEEEKSFLKLLFQTRENSLQQLLIYYLLFFAANKINDRTAPLFKILLFV
jgi:hypothetical protein